MVNNIKVTVRKTKLADSSLIKAVFNQHWGGDFIISLGKIHKPEALDGFIAEINGRCKGLITFNITKQGLEIVSLNSFMEKKGVGTTLVKRVISFAKKEKIKRLWLVTTNDNLNAFRFYQKRGFILKKVYPNSLAPYRKLKPILLIGQNNIPLRDEIELEMRL
ncbi:GNAT family N-acetyltransferase [Candidatus Parcubacteria bacterium]|nr:GNAT family N-acetyltransferase [Patescibacteria group bacterium]MBU4466849.1 GNAT family N-acetyltransferase [Patescibacteria group bacterium]MCG2688730.1 GNAT family N-acetyltransferase [Candidatus Parcubacteria bacterium]